MKNRCTAIFIITSIFILSFKDSICILHTILHYIPNNPWHQHLDIHTHHHIDIHTHHHIDPLQIHLHLQHIHSHQHEHAHVHDILDHIQTEDEKSNKQSSSTTIKLDIKIIYFFLKNKSSFDVNRMYSVPITYNSFYHFSIPCFNPTSLFQPPRLTV